MIHNYFNSTGKLFDLFKNFVIAYLDQKHNAVSSDEKLLVGGLILNHLTPLLDDPYIIETHLFNFIYDLSVINRKEMTTVVFSIFNLVFD